MIAKIAWNNVWRNRLRSSVVILSIATGIWAGVFMMALFKAMTTQRTQDAIETNISHIQVHDSTFLIDKDAGNFIRNPEEVADWLGKRSEVRAFTGRMLIQAMVSSPTDGAGVMVYGVRPGEEAGVTSIHSKLLEGSYLDTNLRHPIVIGKKLADKLKVKMRSKIVLTFQDHTGTLTAGAFRISGIFKTTNSNFDQATLFVLRDDLGAIYGDTLTHEFGVILHSIDQSGTVAAAFNRDFERDIARDWKKLAPELGYADEMMNQVLYIFVFIILLSMAFGIVNTMLMAVLERKHELGMLMCIGMSKAKVFLMITWETIFITSIGGPFGLFIAWLSVRFTHNSGIDLSVVGEGLESLGISTVIYPDLEPEYYLNIALMIIATALISALYPAYKAIRYNPAEAIRGL